MSQNELMAAYALINGKDSALGALGKQYPIARANWDKNYYDPYYGSGAYANSMLMDLNGANGQAGRDRAMGAFQADPGYQFRLNQGLDAINRTAASRGMLASGNNTMDLLNYGQGQASQEYGNWYNRLTDMADRGMTAAAGQQQRQGALSALDYGYGADQAGVYTGTARALADTAMQQEKIDSQKTNGPLSAILGGVNLLSGALGAFRK